jgi:hypothetical protein
MSDIKETKETVAIPKDVLIRWANELSNGVLHPTAEYAEKPEEQLRAFISNMKSAAFGLHGRLLKASRGEL